MNGDPYNSAGPKTTVVKLGVKKAPLPTKQWDAWERIRKIARAAGYNRNIRVDAVQVAGTTLEKAKAGRVKSLFVSIVWDDGSLACDWSQMKSSDLVAHAFNVQSTVQDEVHKP